MPLAKLMNSSFGRHITQGYEKSKDLADTSSQVIMSLLSTVLTVILILAVSIFLYGTFYYAYMPVEMHNLPVNLQFQPCEETYQRCSYPLATLQLRRYQKLLQGQTYSISLKLKIPDSPLNEDHGMFMTCLKISSSSGKQIGESCRSSILEYKSPLLRSMETLSLSPALLTGWSEQKQELIINYFSNFQTDPHTPAEIINVEIQSKHLQISEASLEIHAELKGEKINQRLYFIFCFLGLRHLMYRHPWISAFFGVATNIFVLSTIILISWVRFLQPEAQEHIEGSVEQETAASEVKEPAQEVNVSTGRRPSEALPENAEVITKKSLQSRLMWALFKLLVKLVWSSIKMFMLLAVFVLSYESVVHGVDLNNPESLLMAAKEDIIYLTQEASVKIFMIINKLIDRK